MAVHQIEFPSVLVDRFGRRVEYLRLSVTDRCNFRCHYCLPEAFRGYEQPGNWLTFDEISRVVRLFAELGVRKVRITGGEPLTRRGVPELARRLNSIEGIADLSLSTNGALLAQFAQPLREAGVSRLNVSLDSLNRATFLNITKRNALDDVLAGLEAARDAGFAPIKVNAVVLAESSNQEIDALVDYCIAKGFTLRLIEAMPIGEAGRQTAYRDLRPVRERLRRDFALTDCIVAGAGPAQYLRSADGRFTVGFITAMSQHFCEACNRVRLSVDGTIHPCLGDEGSVPLLPLLRGEASDDDVSLAIRGAVAAKPLAHQFNERPDKVMRAMVTTGG